MNKYLITLTPVDNFFFGGETAFKRSSEDKKDIELNAFNEAYSSYVIASNLFPQQTSLLGMLRFLLLSSDDTLFKNNRIIADKEHDVSNLIGKQSFNLDKNNLTGGKQRFGKIQKLYPCFLQRKTNNSGWKNLVHAPLDYGLNVSCKDGILEIPDFKYKEGLNYGYITNDQFFSEKDLFKKDIRIGINRDFNGKTKSEAYYKQISYRFTKSYKIKDGIREKEEEHTLRFAFYAELDYIFKQDIFIVSLGGDNSKFILEWKQDEALLQISGYKPCKSDSFPGKVVLLSDAYLMYDDLKCCRYHISDVVPFRFLTSNVNVKEYYKLSGDNRLMRSNDKYNLYKRGSVFFFDTITKMKQFTDALDAYQRFIQIGYNNYEQY
jgi:CRISPR-associated protein Cmr3